MADLSNPLDQIEVAQANPATTANELFDAGSPAMIFGRRNRTTSGLTWGYYGGRYRGIAVAHGTIALPASQATVYIVAAKATGVVSQSTSITNWNDSTNYDRLYLAVTGPSTITDHDDYREVVSSAGAGVATIDTEQIQDIVGALLVAGTNVTINYNDAGSPASITINASGAAALTQEQVEDIVGSLITAGSGINATYNDANSPATLSIAATGSVLTEEQVQDIVGAMLTAGSGISLNYNDGDSPATFSISLDADLATIAGLTATTDNFMQAKSSAWASRTVAQVSADLQGTGLITDAVGFRTIPQNSQSAAYECVAADAGKHILHPTADNSARTFTIPANSGGGTPVAYPIGTAITFINEINTVTIAITTDTMKLVGAGTAGSRTLAANGQATAIKTATTTWWISGIGLT